MRSVRAFDRTDLWFAILLAPFFALFAFGFVGAAVTSRNFWLVAAAVIAGSLLRLLLERLGRTARFVALFCTFAVGLELIAWGSGEELSLAGAAGIGLAIAVFDGLVEHFRQRREAEHG
jgi:hypothetical protein